jgi:ADP-ribose pyrophosphatase YjhB (NUDIX family)
MKSISITDSDNRFTYRVVSVIIDDGYILLQTAEMDDFWALPGGRCELSESSIDALKREMKEELETEVKIERLIWIVENFFNYQDKHCQEMGLYFLTTLPENSHLHEKDKTYQAKENDYELIMRWFKLDELNDIILYPEFLRESLNAIPESIEHIIHRGNK